MISRTRKLVNLLRVSPFFTARHRRNGSPAPPRLRFVAYDLGVPARYRVQHQVEQARIAGIDAQETPIRSGWHVYDLTTCDLLYLYRTPLTPRTWPLLYAARRRGIPIIFDSDDLVWDPRERQYNYLDDHYDPRMVAQIMKTTRRTRALMQRVDAFVFATPYLAQLAAHAFSQPIYVNQNALSQDTLARSALAYAGRQQRHDAERVIIGYFCGTPHVHDEDLASIAPALCAVLEQHRQVHLRIYGELALAGPLAEARYAPRIEQRPAVAWQDLPQHIAQVDITIAPLVDNPQRRAKSAVKYMEAAVVGVPTVAARLEPYQYDIAHGETGLLATTLEEWIACLAQLVVSPELRLRMGAAARADVLARHTTAARAPDFAAIIAQVLR